MGSEQELKEYYPSIGLLRRLGAGRDQVGGHCKDLRVRSLRVISWLDTENQYEEGKYFFLCV